MVFFSFHIKHPIIYTKSVKLIDPIADGDLYIQILYPSHQKEKIVDLIYGNYRLIILIRLFFGGIS